MGNIILVRHGETEWSAASRHTSHTDLPLTPAGEQQARALTMKLPPGPYAAVYSSPLQRAIHTATLAGLPTPTTDPDLHEWDYGTDEGRTKAEIWASRPDWNQWRDGFTGGETPADIATRIDGFLARIEPQLAHGDIVIVGHGHASRVLAARWLELPAAAGQLFRLDTATVSILGFEHGTHVMRRWNAP